MDTEQLGVEILKGKDRDFWVGETHILNGREIWTGHYFVHYGKKYATTKMGQTICAGVVAESPQGGGGACPVKKNVVAKILDKETIPPAEKSGIMLQPKKRGRPPKSSGESVCRTTEWRRRKALA